eukprot:GEMP01017681.1.p1 GENE.GEMP01017681.1~~GEMP01017681.1.p1  ORF type:complete len:517 (+),score=116.82 GEMP01017681.1:33-1583(+)
MCSVEGGAWGDCFVVVAGNTRILCGDPTWNTKVVTKGKPIDLWLVSRPANLFLLPNLHRAFPHMQVWVTEPVAFAARTMLQDLLKEQPFDDTAQKRVQRVGSHADLSSAFDSLTLVHYLAPERMHQLVCTAMRSGYCLGGANWLIEGMVTGERVVALGPSSFSPTLSGVINQEIFRDATMILISAVGPDNNAPCDFPKESVATLKEGGNVMIPMDEDLRIAVNIIEGLAKLFLQAGLEHIPIYAIGAVGAMLRRLVCLTDWMLLDPKRDSIGAALKCPVDIDELIRAQRLILGDINEIASVYREPCVVLALHDSLTYGPAQHFDATWRAPSKVFSCVRTGASAAAFCAPLPDSRIPARHVKGLLNTWDKTGKARRLLSPHNAHLASMNVAEVLPVGARAKSTSSSGKFVRGYLTQDIADTVHYTKASDGSSYCDVSGQFCLERLGLVVRGAESSGQAQLLRVENILKQKNVPYDADADTIRIPEYGTVEFRDNRCVIEAESRHLHRRLEELIRTAA